MKKAATVNVLREVAVALDQIHVDESTDADVLEMFSPKVPESGLPEYVSHDELTPHIARLASEVIVRSWELAAQDIEMMGQQLQQQVDNVIMTVREAAASIRKRGIDCFNAIEVAAQMSDVVSRQCAEIRARLAIQDVEGAAGVIGQIKQKEEEI